MFCTKNPDLQSRGEEEQSTTRAALPTRSVGGQEPETTLGTAAKPPWDGEAEPYVSSDTCLVKAAGMPSLPG